MLYNIYSELDLILKIFAVLLYLSKSFCPTQTTKFILTELFLMLSMISNGMRDNRWMILKTVQQVRMQMTGTDMHNHVSEPKSKYKFEKYSGILECK